MLLHNLTKQIDPFAPFFGALLPVAFSQLLRSYGASFFSGLAFFLLATVRNMSRLSPDDLNESDSSLTQVAGLSMLSTYLCSLWPGCKYSDSQI